MLRLDFRQNIEAFELNREDKNNPYKAGCLLSEFLAFKQTPTPRSPSNEFSIIGFIKNVNVFLFVCFRALTYALSIFTALAIMEKEVTTIMMLHLMRCNTVASSTSPRRFIELIDRWLHIMLEETEIKDKCISFFFRMPQ